MNCIHSQIKRRFVLKSMGIAAGGIGATALPANVQARTIVEDDLMASLRNSEKVQSILNEVGLSGVSEDYARQIDIDDDVSLSVAKVGTSVGTLLFGKDARGRESAVMKYESSNPQGVGKGHLQTSGEEISHGSNAISIGTDTGTEFRRSASEEEKSLIANKFGIDVQSSTVIFATDINGFAVAQTESPGQAPQKKQARGGNTTPTVISTGREFNGPSRSVASEIDGDDLEIQVGAQYHNHPCAGWCLTWFLSFSGCVGCAAACVLASPTGAGAILCAICVVGTCVGSVYALGGCGHCLEDEGVI